MGVIINLQNQKPINLHPFFFCTPLISGHCKIKSVTKISQMGYFSPVLPLISFVFVSLLLPDPAHSALRLPELIANHKILPTGDTAVSIDPTRVEQISWHPRAFIYRNFLTDEECDHLMNLAKDKLEKSMVADNESGKSIASEVRTSSGMFLRKAQDEVVSHIESKIAAWTFLPEENGEAIQILHYELGQKYEPHFDYFHDKANQELGGHRIATVLMYLSEVTRGGETVFPNSEAKDTQPKGDDWSTCAKEGYAVKPNKGDALLFFSLHLDATTDPMSLHGSCPVIEGEKWSATKWIHVRSFESKPKLVTTGCADLDKNCARWAAAGECTKNPVYMVGSDDVSGSCRKSCNVCSS